MQPASNQKPATELLLLLTVLGLLAAWVVVRIILSNRTPVSVFLMILLDWPVWLLVGVLLRTVDAAAKRSPGFWGATRGFLLGWASLLLGWSLSFVPGLELDQVGIEIDFRFGPVELLVTVAFLLGYYGQTTQKILPAVWMEGKKLLRKGGIR